MVDSSDSEDNGKAGLMNYKGIYFNDDPNNKYTCPVTGAHFEFNDMCDRLNLILKLRRAHEQKIAEFARKQKMHLKTDGDQTSDERREYLLQMEKEELKKKLSGGKLKNALNKHSEKQLPPQIAVKNQISQGSK